MTYPRLGCGENAGHRYRNLLSSPAICSRIFGKYTKKKPHKGANVPGERLELSRDFSQRLLRPQRLPISPPGQGDWRHKYITRIPLAICFWKKFFAPKLFFCSIAGLPPFNLILVIPDQINQPCDYLSSPAFFLCSSK